MALFDTIVGKLTAKDLGLHLKNYVELFTNPLKVWRQVVLNRQSGYQVLIDHVIYYFLLCFFILEMDKGALGNVFVDVLLTVIPYLITVLPFLLFNKILKLRLKPKNLFYFLAIVKIQIGTFIHLYILFASSFKYEFLYYHVQNIMVFGVFLFIIIFPCVVFIKFWKKILWIFTNYIFFLIYYSMIYLSINLTNEKFEDLHNTLQIFAEETPDSEFLIFFSSKDREFIETLDQSKYMLLVKDEKKKNQTFFSGEIVTKELYSSYLKLFLEQNKDSILLYLKDGKNSPDYRYLDSLNATVNNDFPESKKLTLAAVDSLRPIVNGRMNEIYLITDSLKNKSAFSSNREYFKTLFNFIKNYQNFHGSSNLESVVTSNQLISTIDLGNGYYASMYDLGNYSHPYSSEFSRLELSYLDRIQNSSLLTKLILYPIHHIIE